MIKVLHARHGTTEAMVQRFNREAQLASRLDHPFAAHIYAFGAEPDGLLWIAMELVRGTPLSKVLAAQPGGRRMALARFVPLLDRLCEVVHTAHEQGIVHRDLKPDNVMVLARAGRLLPKLLDLGIAKLVVEPGGARPAGDVAIDDAADPGADTLLPPRADDPLQTQRGVHMGSPFYMAPEQWSDAAEVDARADLYALGVLTYEALCGAVPFPGRTLGEIARGHLHGDVPDLPADLPVALGPVLRRALARRREDRFDTALAFAAAVRAAAGMRMAADALPRLDDALREQIAWTPQPIAEAVAALEAARNPHQARDAVWEIVRVAARYLGLVALACRSRSGAGSDTGDAPGVTALVRELQRRDLDDAEWLDLVRGLTRPFGSAREAHPIPELVDLGAAEPSPFAALLALRAGEGATTTEESLRDRLARTLPLLTPLLRALSFLSDYPLVVPRGDGPVGPASAEAWMGPRRPRRPQLAVGEGLRDGEPALVDLDGRPVVQLAPLVQVAAPAPGAAEELFLLAGPARARGRGARLIAEPHGFERHDDAVWAWFREHLLPVADRADAPVEEAPYRGLHAFTRADARVFFGRERQTDAFVNQLLVRPLLAVVGPSGAGKSSFVQAGVVPALPEGWRAVTLRPGATPMAALAARVDLAAPPPLGETLVVVVDQLEELFTLCLDPAERVRFADSLVRAAGDRVKVVLTLRDDFLARAGELAPLRDRLAQGLTLLATPAPDDLLRILVEPARRAGYDVDDPELPARMVASVAGRPGALALLSFTAARLWELRDRHFRRLTRKAYDAIGGVEGALAGHAEATLQACTAEEQRLVRDAFRHLVTAEGTRAVLTRGELDDVLGRSPHGAAVIERLVQARLLVASEDAEGVETIEVVHEALLSAWPRLVEWRRDDAEGARLRDQLRAAARQWQDRGRARGLLWRDDALDDYRRWRARWPGALPALDEAFAAASLRDARRGRAIRRGLATAAITVLVAGVVALSLLYRSSQHNAARARASATEARRRLTESYIEQGRRYLLDGDYERALPYLAAAYERGDTSTELRFLLARAIRRAGAQTVLRRGDATPVDVAYRGADRLLVVDTTGAAQVLDAADGRVLAALPGAETTPSYGHVSPDGALAVIPRAADVAVWDGATTRTLPIVGARRVAFAASGRTFAVASAGEVALYDAGTLARRWSAPVTATIDALAVGEDAVLGLDDAYRPWWIGPGGARALDGDGLLVTGDPAGRRFVLGLEHAIEAYDARGARQWSVEVPSRPAFAAVSPDGATIAATFPDGVVRLYAAEDGRAVAELVGRSNAAALAFSPDGTRLAVSGQELAMTVWDLRTRAPVVALAAALDTVRRLSFDPTGARIVAAAYDGTVRTFGADDPEAALAMRSDRPLFSADRSADGSTVVAADEGGLEVWDGRTGAARRRLTVATYDHPSVDPDGHSVAVPLDRSDDAVVLDLATGAVLARVHASAHLRWIAFDHAGQRLVTAAGDGAVDVWRRDGTHLAAMRGHTAEARSARFSADDRFVVSASQDGTARVWDADSGAELARFAHGYEVRFADFDATGDRVVTAADNGQAALWDLDRGSVLARFQHGAPLRQCSVSPDGALVAAAAEDGAVDVWDTATGALVASFTHADVAATAQFSPDGSDLLTSSNDGVVALWDVSTTLPTPGSVTAFATCHARWRLIGTRLEGSTPPPCAP